MDEFTKKKWDRFSSFYKFHTFGAEKRWRARKKELFSKMGNGKILFLAVGTGSEIQYFPPGKNIVGIDISSEMLRRARPEVEHYKGNMELFEMDARKISFETGIFDQVFTSCTFCSVPDPVKGLKEVNRVMKNSGELWMFEHTNSKIFPFRQLLALMNPVAEAIGPSLTRNTVENVKKAGFSIKTVFHVYLDIVKIIHAVKESP